MTFNHISQEVLRDLGFIKLVRNTIREDSTDTTFEREAIDHVGAALVIPVMANGDIILIDQYRSAPDLFVLEAVAGRFDHDGEEARECAKRELFEEIGVVSDSFVSLGSWLVSPGWTNEVNHGFLALDCAEPVEAEPDGIEEKFSNPVRLSIEEAQAHVSSGVIIDAKTIILLNRIEQYLKSINQS